MKVTDVRLNVVNSDSAVKAIGSFTLDEAFAIRGIRVMEDKNGHRFMAFPSREKQDGSYEDIAFPLNKELYVSITSAILNEYEQILETKGLEQEQTDKELSTKPFAKNAKSR